MKNNLLRHLLLIIILLVNGKVLSALEKPDMVFKVSPKGKLQVVRFLKDQFKRDDFLLEKRAILQNAIQSVNLFGSQEVELEPSDIPLPEFLSKKNILGHLRKGNVTPKVKLLDVDFVLLEDLSPFSNNVDETMMHIASLDIYTQFDSEIPLNANDLFIDFTKDGHTYQKLSIQNIDMVFKAINLDNDPEAKLNFKMRVDIFLQANGEVSILFNDNEFSSNLQEIRLDNESFTMNNAESIPFLNTAPSAKYLANVPNFIRHHMVNFVAEKMEEKYNFVFKYFTGLDIALKDGIHAKIKENLKKHLEPIINKTANEKIEGTLPFNFKLPVPEEYLKKNANISYLAHKPTMQDGEIYIPLVNTSRKNIELEKVSFSAHDNDFAIYLNCNGEQCLTNEFDLEGTLNAIIPTYKNIESIDTKKMKVSFDKNPSLENKTITAEFDIDLQLAILDGSFHLVDDLMIKMGKGLTQKKKRWYQKIPLIGSLISVSKKTVGILFESVGELAGSVYDELVATERLFLRQFGKEYFVEVPVQANVKIKMNNPNIEIMDREDDHMVSISIENKDQVDIIISPRNITTSLLKAKKLQESLNEIVEKSVIELIEGRDFVVPVKRVARFDSSIVEFTNDGGIILRGDFEDELFEDFFNKFIESCPSCSLEFPKPKLH